MPKQILIPLPARDFDPTETAIPWKILKSAGVSIIFSTPQGLMGVCDPHMLTGTGLSFLSPVLSADPNARNAYQEMQQTAEFQHPIKWSEIDPNQYDGILLPGGHAKGMREYLESPVLQKIVSSFFEVNKPVGAICHGVVLAARSKTKENKSVLFGFKTTALLASQEMLAWMMTCTWMGSYYRTYPQTVEAEVKSALQSPKDFLTGPLPLFRDSLTDLGKGFVVQDRNYLSARWPGDAHRFGVSFLEMIK